MPLNSKFLSESTDETIVKIAQYLVKIWKKYHSLLIFGPLCIWPWYINIADSDDENTNRATISCVVFGHVMNRILVHF